MKKLLPLLILLVLGNCRETPKQPANENAPSQEKDEKDILSQEKDRVLEKAEEYMGLEPITVTATVSERSTGGIHDFYSEGDYWWPDPENPEGPYIRKDGMTNPDNFTAHREAMIRLSQISGALASAYLVSGDEKYVVELLPHLKAWFVDESTLMNPNLLYGQAIMGRVTGRGIGIIDTIHLMEVAKAVASIEEAEAISDSDITQLKKWFATYLDWIFTHEYGIAERDNGNNHSVCWALQASVFAGLVNNTEVRDYCRNMYKTVLLPDQMAENGSFPLEIERTKPYGYSLFTLDAMTGLCQELSTSENDLFEFSTPEGKGIQKGLAFLYPYVKDKSSWPYKKDVMYWDEWPVRHASFLFGGLALEKDDYLKLWKSLDADFDNPEVVRNMPIRYPLLWVE
ncbi:MAG: alginate lyase family protein [Pricia sp.]